MKRLLGMLVPSFFARGAGFIRGRCYAAERGVVNFKI